MKYTFINKNGRQQTITIPDEYITVNTRNLGITKREAIEMYLSDEGYIDNEVVAELTEKAAGVKNRVQGERKKRERKPDEIKRSFISALEQTLNEEWIVKFKISNVYVENLERIISFEHNGETYNITLSRKRKPKD